MLNTSSGNSKNAIEARTMSDKKMEKECMSFQKVSLFMDHEVERGRNKSVVKT